jgi:hypothetical protein
MFFIETSLLMLNEKFVGTHTPTHALTEYFSE